MRELAATIGGRLARWHAVARDERLVLAAFATAIFTSALLLFSVQPMFAKLVLPKLGGSPTVWAVSMCFFQAALLAGYCYAHALIRALSPAGALLTHLALLALTCLALPIGLPAASGEPPAGDAYVWLIGLLAMGVGLPFFAVSASAPLLQAWFARTGHAQSDDPYFLYGASNFGSLLALLAYPVLIEPALGLKVQSGLWGHGFVLLALFIAVCGGLMLARRPAEAAPFHRASFRTGSASGAGAESVTCSRRALWIALSFLPSGLLVAVTTYITTDVASAPFIWAVPLALFLATFILVFRERPVIHYGFTLLAFPVCVLVVILAQAKLVGSIFGVAAFFFASLVCHRELYHRRPGAAHLTEFYLWMSLGGVLGGIFAALIAPRLFTSVFEFPLLLLLALLCRPGILLGRDEPMCWRRLALIAIAGIGVMLAYKGAVAFRLISSDPAWLYLLIALLCIGLLQVRSWPEHRPALVLTMILGAGLQPGDNATIHIERSFFGTHRVTDTPSGDMRLLLHGTTVHGAQRLKDAQGRVVAHAQPATYYYAGGPMARGVALARATSADRPLRVGVVGLGAGSLACYSAPGESWRFYEIDPVVARIASDPRLFSFLSRCQPAGPTPAEGTGADIVLGDARLTLAREPAGSFGYLVIDAFSSDSIPTHLLTVEAIAIYLEKIATDGLVALHVSNRHLDLVPALAATIARVPAAHALFVNDVRPEDTFDAATSQVVLIARRRTVLDGAQGWHGARPLPAGAAAVWTDDYSDVLTALIGRRRQ